jgi:hypothetical protein
MQICRVCSDLRREEINAALTSGVNDHEVARRYGIRRAAIQRHRVSHLIQPARDRLALLTKDSEERRQRRELAQAAREDEPSTEALVAATLGMRAQVSYLSEVKADLRHGATIARAAGSPGAVAQIAGQALRHVEVSSKLGGTGGYRSPTTAEGGGEAGNKWSIVFNFASSGRTETITVTAPGGNRSNDSDESGDIVDGVIEE